MPVGNVELEQFYSRSFSINDLEWCVQGGIHRPLLLPTGLIKVSAKVKRPVSFLGDQGLTIKVPFMAGMRAHILKIPLQSKFAPVNRFHKESSQVLLEKRCLDSKVS